MVATELTDHTADREIREALTNAWKGKRQLESDDIARAILYVVSQPERVNVNELLVRPTDQET